MADAKIATLHHQLAYRLQDHCIDLAGYGTPDALFILAETADKVLTIVQAPKQIDSESLSKLFPTSWITNYEKLMEEERPVQTQECIFVKRSDGTVETIFKEPEEARASTSRPSIFKTQYMIQPVSADRTIPIVWFQSSGEPVYASHINGHFIWDTAPEECDEDCPCRNDYDEDEFLPSFFKPKGRLKLKRLSCRPIDFNTRRKDDPDYPWVGISEETRRRSDQEMKEEMKNHPLPIYRKAFRILEKEGFFDRHEKCQPISTMETTVAPPVPCYMASPAKPTLDLSSEEEYPPLPPTTS